MDSNPLKRPAEDLHVPALPAGQAAPASPKRAKLDGSADGGVSATFEPEDSAASLEHQAADVLSLSDSEDVVHVPEHDAPAALNDEDEKLFASLEDDEFAIVLGGVPSALPQAASFNAPSAAAGSSTAAAQDGAKKDQPPAMRFSGASATSLGLRTTPEQEEALRVMGVTGLNYAQMMNPQGFVPGRRANAFETDIDTLDHPKWREPGTVLSDFFNYGLSEVTWREYAARQVALRLFRLKKVAEASGGGAGE
jgi:hypothetical protein